MRYCGSTSTDEVIQVPPSCFPPPHPSLTPNPTCGQCRPPTLNHPTGCTLPPTCDELRHAAALYPPASHGGDSASKLPGPVHVPGGGGRGEGEVAVAGSSIRGRVPGPVHVPSAGPGMHATYLVMNCRKNCCWAPCCCCCCTAWPSLHTHTQGHTHTRSDEGHSCR